MQSRQLSIAAILVCHNRRELTVRAVRSLRAASDDVGVRVVLFDDASSDGTAQAVIEEMPDAIILQGDGQAFWNGGLHRAWQHAMQLEVDAFLWLNDDVELDADAIKRLAKVWQELAQRGENEFILVGATRDQYGEITYGGMRRRTNPIALKLELQAIAGTLQRVDTFNGNIVLIPRTVTEKIGINDPVFFHKFGDVDYGLTASKAGIPSYVLPGTLGVCEKNAPISFSGLSFVQRWKLVNSHLGLPMASWWRLVRRHSGLWFLFHFLSAYYRAFTSR